VDNGSTYRLVRTRFACGRLFVLGGHLRYADELPLCCRDADSDEIGVQRGQFSQ